MGQPRAHCPFGDFPRSPEGSPEKPSGVDETAARLPVSRSAASRFRSERRAIANEHRASRTLRGRMMVSESNPLEVWFHVEPHHLCP